MTPVSASLIAEIESSLAGHQAGHRSDVLHKVTDLFLAGAESFATDQRDLFDDVFCHLVQKIERDALIELSGQLAPVAASPANIVRRLARDGDILVAGPVLERSDALTEADLLEIAQSMGQDHLYAIAGRYHVSEAVSGVLVNRGDEKVLYRVAGNEGAHFSRLTMAALLGKAGTDAELASRVANRADIPPELFDHFVARATEAVRSKILESVRPLVRQRVELVIADVAKKIAGSEAPAHTGSGGARGVRPTPATIRERIIQSAKAGRSAETLTALAICCDVPIAAVKNVHRQKSEEGMIILGKAAGLGWPDMKDVFKATLPDAIVSRDTEKALFGKFLALNPVNAQRVLRFIRGSQKLSNDEIRKMI